MNQIASYMPHPCFTAADVDKIEELVSHKSSIPDAISFARQLLNASDVNSDTDDVFALCRLINELDTQIADDDNADRTPIEDIISDCRAIIGARG